MHLLREGQFAVASTFLTEIAQRKTPAQASGGGSGGGSDGPGDADTDAVNAEALPLGQIQSDEIRKQFAIMYRILDELKQHSNLLPATQWAREHRHALETRGSNLEFELCRLQFVWLFNGGGNPDASVASSVEAAVAYARREFQAFGPRHLREIEQLMGAMAFFRNLDESPYRAIFKNPSSWNEIALFFTREFCSLLGLSADSPLYIAATAGAIALPTLLKLQTIMKAKRTEWTTQNELPVCPCPVSLASWMFECCVDADCSPGRNPTTTIVPVPLDLRVPRVERADDGPEPADDDAVWPCHCGRVTHAAEQRHQVQVSVLSK
jgi:E3 ubiquitin-protein transferase RMND5